MLRIIILGVFALLLLYVERTIYRKYWSRGLDAQIRFRQFGIFEGERGVLTEEVVNRSRFPLSMVKCKFQTDRQLSFVSGGGSVTTDKFYRNDVFQIGPREKITRSLDFTGIGRGYFHITEMDMISTDLLFTEQYVVSKPISTSIYVYPLPCRDNSLQNALSALTANLIAFRPPMEEPFSFRGIREYAPGDDPRSINWGASAKTGDLLVNVREYIALRPVRIYLDLEDTGILKKVPAQEYCIRVAAGIAEYFFRQGVGVSLHSNVHDQLQKDHLLTMDANSQGSGFEELLQALARADLEHIDGFGQVLGDRIRQEEVHGNPAFPIFVSPNLYQDLQDILEDLEQMGSDYKLIYPVPRGEKPEIPGSISSHTEIITFE